MKSLLLCVLSAQTNLQAFRRLSAVIAACASTAPSGASRRCVQDSTEYDDDYTCNHSTVVGVTVVLASCRIVGARRAARR